MPASCAQYENSPPVQWKSGENHESADHMGCHVLSMDWMCSLAFILNAAILELRWSTSSSGYLSVNAAGHWYGGGAIVCIPWPMGGGVFRKPWLVYPGWRPCDGPMNPGMLCTGVALVSGEVSHGSRGRELATGPTLVCIGGRLKESTGESWSFMLLASIFSWRLHLALRFWNHTCATDIQSFQSGPREFFFGRQESKTWISEPQMQLQWPHLSGDNSMLTTTIGYSWQIIQTKKSDQPHLDWAT